MTDSYIGRDGLTHQFTKVDWEEKTKIGTTVVSPEEASTIKKELAAYRDGLAQRILACPAELAGERYFDFVSRDVKAMKISWITAMITSPGMSIEQLRDMACIMEKRKEAFDLHQLSLKTPQVK